MAHSSLSLTTQKNSDTYRKNIIIANICIVSKLVLKGNGIHFQEGGEGVSNCAKTILHFFWKRVYAERICSPYEQILIFRTVLFSKGACCAVKITNHVSLVKNGKNHVYPTPSTPPHPPSPDTHTPQLFVVYFHAFPGIVYMITYVSAQPWRLLFCRKGW